MKTPVLILALGLSTAPAAETWPIVRGNAELQGVAASPVKAPLKLAWSYKAAPPILATPVTDGTRAYFGDGDGVFHAVNLAKGEKAWTYVIMDEKKGKPSRDPIEGSACLTGGKVIVGGTDGVIRAFDPEKGNQVWTHDTKGEIKGGMTPFRRGETDAAVSVGFGGSVVAVAVADGKELWTYDAGGPVNGAASVSAAGLVFGGCNGTLDIINLDGVLQKRIDLKIYMPNSVAVRGGLGYCGHSGNKIECYDLRDGKPVWQFRDKDFAYFTSPAVTEEWVLAGGDDKRLHCLQRKDGEEKWSFKTRDKVTSSPVVAGDLVVFGSDDGRVYAVDLASGEEKWSYEIGAPVKSSPAVVGGRVLVGADDGSVYCFESAK